jgi:hypothetical protein
MGNIRFSREPALWIAAIGALLAVLVAFGVPSSVLSDDKVGAIVAAITALTGIWTAWKTRPIAPALVVGLGTAAFQLLEQYGFHATPEMLSRVNVALLALGFLLRSVITPAGDPAPIAPTVGKVR